jgi:hypothetical protein
MLERFLYYPSGRVRLRGMATTVGGFIALALLGTLLLAITPQIDNSLLQTGWVLFAVLLLKLPLVGLLCWLILRHLEYPTRRPRWSNEEVSEIIDYLRAEAERAEEMPDAERRLAYLLGESWHVADRADGQQKGDAVATALEIDARLHGRRRGAEPRV